MITEKQIEIANTLIQSDLIDRVFHSVELVEDDKGAKFPAYKTGDEQYYVGPDDSKKMFAYIRTLGAAAKIGEGLEGSCSKMYRMGVPVRVVVFQDGTKDDFDSLIQRLLKVSFIKDVSLIGWNNNSFLLGKQESPIGNFAFDATTFYLAIDLQIKVWLYGNQCDEDVCKVFPNPIISNQ
jgi:hypothetical protein